MNNDNASSAGDNEGSASAAGSGHSPRRASGGSSASYGSLTPEDRAQCGSSSLMPMNLDVSAKSQGQQRILPLSAPATPLSNTSSVAKHVATPEATKGTGFLEDQSLETSSQYADSHKQPPSQPPKTALERDEQAAYVAARVKLLNDQLAMQNAELQNLHALEFATSASAGGGGSPTHQQSAEEDILIWAQNP